MLKDARRSARLVLCAVGFLHAGACGENGPRTRDAGGAEDATIEDSGRDWGDGNVGLDGGHLDAQVEQDASGTDDADVPNGGLDTSLPDASAQDASDAGADGDAAAETTFDDVYAILSEHCAFCHVPGSIGYNLGKLNMSTRELAYKNLVGFEEKGVLAAGIHCGPPESPPGYRRVVPYKPEESLILNKLSRTPRCGVPMPDNYPALSDEQVALISAWIAAGAKKGADPEVDAGVEYPMWLSQTGLFADVEADEMAPAVTAFEPRYKLWSDGADKRRFVRLPEDATIDTSDMDRWIYPVGTKVWKEFSVTDIRVETRLIEKTGQGRWVMVSYQWLEDGTDAFAVPEGVLNANGTQHDIPDAAACIRCHGGLEDALLGFSALQLTHNLGGLTTDALAQAGRLSHPPAEPCVLPGDETAQQALGYLHANCGHCHNPWSQVFTQLKTQFPFTGGPIFWEQAGKLSSLRETNGYVSTVGQPNSILPDLYIIEPGDAERSELFVRMGQRGESSLQMPPIATEQVDEVGLAAVRAFIESLPP